jgi:hypothetical protein
MSGIPYMGSKRKLAYWLISFLIRENPQARHFFDLFGGGGAVSFEAIQCGQFASVHYNDANTAVVALMRKLQTDGVTDEMFEWVGREAFFELIKGSDWRAGLAQTCWSFGNKGNSYLFGRDIEPIKKAAHELVVKPSSDTAKAFEAVTGLTCPPYVYEARRDWFDAESITERRLRVTEWIQEQSAARFDLQSLERLERLESLERLERLEITNLDYRAVSICADAIIYCDRLMRGRLNML